MHYVYIVKCADGSLYTGYTTNIKRRLREHNGEIEGGAKYTSGRGPVELFFSEAFESRSDAQKRESSIKTLSRKKKLELVENG